MKSFIFEKLPSLLLILFFIQLVILLGNNPFSNHILHISMAVTIILFLLIIFILVNKAPNYRIDNLQEIEINSISTKFVQMVNEYLVQVFTDKGYQKILQEVDSYYGRVAYKSKKHIIYFKISYHQLDDPNFECETLLIWKSGFRKYVVCLDQIFPDIEGLSLTGNDVLDSLKVNKFVTLNTEIIKTKLFPLTTDKLSTYKSVSKEYYLQNKWKYSII